MIKSKTDEGMELNESEYAKFSSQEPFHFSKIYAKGFQSYEEAENIIKKNFLVNLSKTEHIYQFQEDLLNLLMDTKPREHIKTMPFPSLFFNNDIKLSENNTLKGVYIFAYTFSDKTEQMANISIPLRDDEEYVIGFFATGFKNKKSYYFTTPNLFKNQAYNTLEGKKQSEIQKEIGKIRNLVSNLVYALAYHYDEIIVEKRDNLKRNIKREKRNKSLYVSKYKYIYLTGILKRYASAYLSAKKKQEWKSKVDGFFRHYKSERYVNVRGQIQWIFPYIRGAELPERPNIQLTKVKSTKTFQEKFKKSISGELK